MPDRHPGDPVSSQPGVLRPALRDHVRGPTRMPVRAPLPEDVAAVYQKVNSDPQLPRVLGTLANSPLVAKRLSVLLAGLLGKGCLPPREREIVILRMGWRCGSRYEFTGHIGIGRDAGLTDDEIESITMDPASSGLPSGDASLIRVVDELYDGNAVTQATWDLLAERWSSDQLVEIVVVAGIYWTISGFLNAMRVVPEDHWPGWPNGVAPTGRE